VPCLNVKYESLSIDTCGKRSTRNQHGVSLEGRYDDGIAIIVHGPDLRPSAGSIDKTNERSVTRLIKLEGANFWLESDLRP
jgi:hypothetical protein